MSLRVHAVLTGMKTISVTLILGEGIYKRHQYSIVDASALRDAYTANMAAADLGGARRARLVTCVASVL
jgi:hypothetical protein